MSLMLNLSPEIESELTAEASRMGLPLSEYVERILLAGRPLGAVPQTGPELVSYWQSEGLVGARTDIVNSQDHSRELRQQAEQRRRP